MSVGNLERKITVFPLDYRALALKVDSPVSNVTFHHLNISGSTFMGCKLVAFVFLCGSLLGLYLHPAHPYV